MLDAEGVHLLLTAPRVAAVQAERRPAPYHHHHQHQPPLTPRGRLPSPPYLWQAGGYYLSLYVCTLYILYVLYT